MGVYEQLAETLSAFDVADLLSGVGGLALIPENADHFLRLERLAGLICALLEDDEGEKERPRMSIGRWRQALNGEPIASSTMLSAEDPYEEAFTTLVAFYGGSYVLPPCSFAGSAQAVQRLVDGIFQIRGDLVPEYLSEMFHVFSAVLRLSNAVCAKAGLTRFMSPEPGKNQPVQVPSGSALQSLKDAVRFTNEEMEELWPDWHHGLEPLLLDLSAAEQPIGEERFHDVVSARPIAMLPEEIIVAVPTSLAVALRHRAIVSAREHGLLEALAEVLREAVLIEIKRSLSRFGLRTEIPMPPDAPTLDIAIDIVRRFDEDKVLHVVVITDPLSDYEETSLDGIWSTPNLPERLDEHLRSVRNLLMSEMSDVSGVLHLIVMESYGRSHITGLLHKESNPRYRTLGITSEGLEVMALKMRGDPLGLWKFARANEELHERTRVIAFNKLALYELYTNHDDSFCLSDDKPPNVLLFEPDQGRDIRIEAMLEVDRHAARSWANTKDIVVERLMGGTRIPIYATVDDGQVAMLLEGVHQRTWVRSTSASTAPRGDVWEFCDLLIYWLWQIDMSVDLQPQDLVVHATINAHLDSHNDDDNAWFHLERSGEGARLIVGVDEFMTTSGPDNENERTLVAALLHVLYELGSQEVPPEFDQKLTTICSPPTKKKMVSLSVGPTHIELAPGTLEAPRRIQPADVSEQLDKLGHWLGSRVPEGKVRDEDRGKILNDVVDHLFKEFQNLVGALSPDGLVNFLVLQNESLIRADALRDLMIPTRMACFANEEEVLTELANDFSSETSTAIANRFCIEYVVAQPPTGSLPLTMERYDALMACSSEIINKGMLSDSLYTGVSDETLSLLPSGRLGISRDGAFSIASNSYRDVMAQMRVEGTSGSFERHWEAPSSADNSPSYFAGLDSAFAFEFGLTMQEHADFVGAIVSSGLDPATDACRLRRSELVDLLVGDLKWTSERVTKVMDEFSLSLRDDFLPRGRGADVYPWRYSRDFSYLRRPLLIATLGDEEWVLWGTRNLWRLGKYLLSQCLSGRFKARTDEMRSFIGTLRGTEPEKFNDDVFDEVSRLLPEAKVFPRVTQVGGRRLERSNGEVIGDVDVLAIDPRSQKVFAIEVKDYSLARNVQEIASESESLLTGPKSTMVHHGERTQWLEDNLEHVIRSSGFTFKRKWKVHALVVTSHELMSPQFQSTSIEVVALGSLERRLRSLAR
jgi:hypothetical protein